MYFTTLSYYLILWGFALNNKAKVLPAMRTVPGGYLKETGYIHNAQECVRKNGGSIGSQRLFLPPSKFI